MITWLLFSVPLIAPMFAHDSWLIPLIEHNFSFGLTSGTRFPHPELGPRLERVASFAHVTEGKRIQPVSLGVLDGYLVAQFSGENPFGIIEARLHPHPISFSPEEFATYLGLEGATHMLDESAKLGEQVRESYSKCCKLLLDTNAGSLLAGHPLEIVTENPGEFRVVGVEATNRQVFVSLYSSNGTCQKARTLSDGKFYFDLDRSISWMLRAHAIRPSTTENADFESFWCSMVIPAEC